MKKLIYALAFTLSFTQYAAAEIRGSDYEGRHQKLIEKAIYKQCGLAGTLTQVSSEVQVVRVDQGIRDEFYTTLLEMKVGIDQYAYDSYSVLVKSARYAQYDHEASDYGHYSVDSVQCTQIDN